MTQMSESGISTHQWIIIILGVIVTTRFVTNYFSQNSQNSANISRFNQNEILQKNVLKQEHQINQLNEQLKEKSNVLILYEQQIAQLNEQLEGTKNILKLQEEEITFLIEYQKGINNVENFEHQITQLNEQLQEKSNVIKHQELQIAKLKKQFQQNEIRFEQKQKEETDQENEDIEKTPSESLSFSLLYFTGFSGMLYQLFKNQKSIQTLKQQVSQKQITIEEFQQNSKNLLQNITSEKITNKYLKYELDLKNQEKTSLINKNNNQKKTIKQLQANQQNSAIQINNINPGCYIQ